jgi:methylated-DNA-[protein]-cysteine S-methyltransferase
MRYRKEVAHQLERYFQDPVLQFSLPLALEGTPFQLRVWQALQAIPSGETRTYGALAQTLDSGSRAVGNACRRNPVSIIVPCHRVVSATGMGGYSGNTSDRAIWRKHWLLAHEGADCTGLKNRRLPPPSGAHRTIQRTTHA